MSGATEPSRQALAGGGWRFQARRRAAVIRKCDGVFIRDPYSCPFFSHSPPSTTSVAPVT